MSTFFIGKMDVVNMDEHNTFCEILKSGSLEMVTKLYESGELCRTYLSEDRMVCYLASKNPSVDVLKFVHEKGYSLGSKCIVNAIAHGNLPMLIYLHQHGCPSDLSQCLLNCDLADKTQIALCCRYAVTHYGWRYDAHNQWHTLTNWNNK